MPPMAALLPMSVAPRPPEVKPPRCRPNSTTTATLPIRLHCTAAATPPEVQCRRMGKVRSEEHTSELQSRLHLVCRLLLEKKKVIAPPTTTVESASVRTY